MTLTEDSLRKMMFACLSLYDEYNTLLAHLKHLNYRERLRNNSWFFNLDLKVGLTDYSWPFLHTLFYQLEEDLVSVRLHLSDVERRIHLLSRAMTQKGTKSFDKEEWEEEERKVFELIEKSNNKLQAINNVTTTVERGLFQRLEGEYQPPLTRPQFSISTLPSTNKVFHAAGIIGDYFMDILDVKFKTIHKPFIVFGGEPGVTISIPHRLISLSISPRYKFRYFSAIGHEIGHLKVQDIIDDTKKYLLSLNSEIQYGNKYVFRKNKKDIEELEKWRKTRKSALLCRFNSGLHMWEWLRRHPHKNMKERYQKNIILDMVDLFEEWLDLCSKAEIKKIKNRLQKNMKKESDQDLNLFLLMFDVIFYEYIVSKVNQIATIAMKHPVPKILCQTIAEFIFTHLHKSPENFETTRKACSTLLDAFRTERKKIENLLDSMEKGSFEIKNLEEFGVNDKFKEPLLNFYVQLRSVYRQAIIVDRVARNLRLQPHWGSFIESCELFNKVVNSLKMQNGQTESIVRILRSTKRIKERWADVKRKLADNPNSEQGTKTNDYKRTKKLFEIINEFINDVISRYYKIFFSDWEDSIDISRYLANDDIKHATEETRKHIEKLLSCAEELRKRGWKKIAESVTQAVHQEQYRILTSPSVGELRKRLKFLQEIITKEEITTEKGEKMRGFNLLNAISKDYQPLETYTNSVLRVLFVGYSLADEAEPPVSDAKCFTDFFTDYFGHYTCMEAAYYDSLGFTYHPTVIEYMQWDPKTSFFDFIHKERRLFEDIDQFFIDYYPHFKNNAEKLSSSQNKKLAHQPTLLCLRSRQKYLQEPLLPRVLSICSPPLSSSTRFTIESVYKKLERELKSFYTPDKIIYGVWQHYTNLINNSFPNTEMEEKGIVSFAAEKKVTLNAILAVWKWHLSTLKSEREEGITSNG